MKTIKTIILGIFAMLFMNCSFASEKDNDLMAMQVKVLKSNIGEQLYYPEDAREAKIEGTVAASIRVLSNGKVLVNAINGHPMLKASIKEQIESIKLETNSLLSGEEIILKIQFNIE